MSQVRRVIVQLEAPTKTSEGQITEGYYVVDDGMLVMTHPDGRPVDDTAFRHILEPGDNPAAIAMVLTRKVRRHLKGITEKQEKFARKIDYGKAGVA